MRVSVQLQRALNSHLDLEPFGSQWSQKP